MSKKAKVSGFEGEPEKEKPTGSAGLTVKNLWSSLDILTVFFDQLPPTTVPDLKSLRLVNSTFKKLSLNKWRNTATIRICSQEDYKRYQAYSKFGGSVKGISMNALLDDLNGNKQKLKEFPFSSYDIQDKVTFPLGEEHSGNFPFWKTFGPQMKYIQLSSANFHQDKGNNGFHCFLQLCPNLEKLAINIKTCSGDFIKYDYLERLGYPNHIFNNDRNFENKQLKTFIFEKHESAVGEPHFAAGMYKLKDLFKMTPAMQTLQVDCLGCSQTILEILISLCYPTLRKGIQLKSLKMILEPGQDMRNLLEYITLSEFQLQQLNLNILLKSGEIMNNDIFEPLKLCKDFLEDLTLKLNGLHGNSEIHPDLGNLSDCTFRAMKSLTLKLKYWREGPLGHPGGVSFPLLTTLKIICFCHEGKWFDLLNNCSFPSLTSLEISFEWEDDNRISNNLDFSALKGMPKLERLCFKDINDNEAMYPSNFVTTYVVTPYKMLYKGSLYARKRSLEPEHYYSFLCLKKITVFYYPAIFTVDSLLLIRRWMPNLRVLKIGADMDCLDAIFSLFMDLNKITLFVKFDTEDDMFKKVTKGFPGKLYVVRVR